MLPWREWTGAVIYCRPPQELVMAIVNRFPPYLMSPAPASHE
jgi:hypothetical protein